MKFSLAFITAIAATAVAAAPAVEAEPVMNNIEARAEPLADFWLQPQFLGIKKTGINDPEVCVNFPNAVNNKISSAKARPGFRCTVWRARNCNGVGFSFNSNGSKKLPKWINNKPSSWKCVTA